MSAHFEIDPAELPGRLRALPDFERLQTVAGGTRAYLVGGTVRDLLLGSSRLDLDVAVEGDLRPLADALDGRVIEHERFQTAKVELADMVVDLARTRAETYPHPGALPEVRPARITDDLARRDFTINAMAVPLERPTELLDPHGGLEDLRGGVLRVLHERSFSDDPTRALRAARYTARYELRLDERTEELLRGADLGTVSTDRVEAELRRGAAEQTASRGPLSLAVGWGLIALPEGGLELAAAVCELLLEPPWGELLEEVREWGPLERGEVVLAASGWGQRYTPAHHAAAAIAREHPERPSQAERLARGRRPLELLLARAMGAEWLDRYLEDWARVRLEIDGSDLIEAGIEEGPAVGRGLEAALSAKLDGEVAGREGELEVALAAARGEIPED